MNNRSDVFNIQGLFFSIAAGPFLVLLLLGVIDVSWNHFVGQQVAEIPCNQTAQNVAFKPSDSNCQK